MGVGLTALQEGSMATQVVRGRRPVFRGLGT